MSTDLFCFNPAIDSINSLDVLSLSRAGIFMFYLVPSICNVFFHHFHVNDISGFNFVK